AGALVAVALVGIAYWDQVPANDPEARAASIAAFDSDAAFVAGLEASLPPGASVFQLPYVPFPESPPTGGSLDQDRLRLDRPGDALGWSGGGIRGRAAIDGLGDIAALPAGAFVREAGEAGFASVVVDRAGDPDGTIEAGLAAELGAPAVESADARF